MARIHLAPLFFGGKAARLDAIAAAVWRPPARLDAQVARSRELRDSGVDAAWSGRGSAAGEPPNRPIRMMAAASAAVRIDGESYGLSSQTP